MKILETVAEITRLKKQFEGADPIKIETLEGLIEQAAHERVYLALLNKKALETGLIKYHPDDLTRQQALPISAEITRHSAAYTNIMDKLMKHLGMPSDEDDDGLDDYA